jgi:26S proteasome regulatory subunit N13
MKDLIIFPEEATFKRVKQCTTGRVYLLEWKATARRLFFWMQEPAEDKDAENANNINKFINNPPTASEGSFIPFSGHCCSTAIFL